MSNDLNHLGLSPAQERVAAAVAEAGLDVGSTGRGRILFVEGPSRSGTSHLIDVTARRLDDRRLRVAVGRADEQALEQRSDWARSTEALAKSALSVVSALDPSFALMSSLAGFSTAALGALKAATETPGGPAELLIRALRAAALEASERPLACLVDDAKWLDGSWWTELQLSFAREVVERLPLLLVIAVETTPSLESGEAGDDPPARVARSLLARGLADSISLEGLTRLETSDWLGRMPREAGRAVVELTGGLTGEVADLWQAWLDYGVLEPSGRSWAIGDADGIVDDAMTVMSTRIESLRKGQPRAGDDLLREALAFGATEGRAFTAAAVARALGRDRDLVEDLLDEVVAEGPNTGILRPPRAIEIRDPLDQRSTVLWRYEFANGLFWRGARDRLSDRPLTTRAAAMLDALMDAFGGEAPLILPSLARLADLSGDGTRAARCRSLIHAPTDAALAAQAKLVLTADRSDWGATEHRDAAEILGDAALGLAYAEDDQLPMTFARQAAEDALAAGELGGRARAFAFTAEGFLHSRRGELELAERRLDAAREIVKQGAPGLLASILRQLAEVKRDQPGTLGERKALLDEALRLYRRVNDRKGEGTVKYNLAGIAGREKDLPRARALNEEALAVMRAHWDRNQEMSCLLQRANIEEKEERFDRAREDIREVLRYQTAAGRRHEQADCLSRLSGVELAAGNPGEAFGLANEALAIQRGLKTRNTRDEARHLKAQSRAALALDEVENLAD